MEHSREVGRAHQSDTGHVAEPGGGIVSRIDREKVQAKGDIVAVERVLERPGVEARDDVGAAAGAEEIPGFAPTPEGWLRTDPAMLAEAGGLDGFFVARFLSQAE